MEEERHWHQNAHMQCTEEDGRRGGRGGGEEREGRRGGEGGEEGRREGEGGEEGRRGRRGGEEREGRGGEGGRGHRETTLWSGNGMGNKMQLHANEEEQGEEGKVVGAAQSISLQHTTLWPSLLFQRLHLPEHLTLPSLTAF